MTRSPWGTHDDPGRDPGWAMRDPTPEQIEIVLETLEQVRGEMTRQGVTVDELRTSIRARLDWWIAQSRRTP